MLRQNWRRAVSRDWIDILDGIVVSIAG